MKKTLVIAGLALLSTNAFASKARLEALEGYNGAAKLYVSDKRNIFRNAATLNSNKNFVVTEWGANPTAGDTTGAPQAEGGFFRDAGSMAYGLYFGRDNNNDVRPAAYLDQDNALDLFIAGDAGVQWGATLHYANGKDESAAIKKKQSALGLGLGMVMGAVEGYANIDLSDKSEGGAAAADQWKAKPSFTVGGSYAWSGYTFFAELANGKVEDTVSAVTTSSKSTSAVVGAGHIMEVNPTARVIMDASLAYEKTEVGTTKDTTMGIPVTVGFEADATSWLTLRGSVGQNVILNSEKNETAGATTKSTTANTTTVKAGASLNFGKLAVDGSFGTAANTNVGKLNTDELMSRVGVTYNF